MKFKRNTSYQQLATTPHYYNYATEQKGYSAKYTMIKLNNGNADKFLLPDQTTIFSFPWLKQ
jgi:hypothetical protein